MNVLLDYTYDKEVFAMGNGNKKKKIESINEDIDKESKLKKTVSNKNTSTKTKNLIKAAVITAITTLIITCCINFIPFVVFLPQNLETQGNDIKEIKNTLSNLNDSMTAIKIAETNITNLDRRLSNLEEKTIYATTEYVCVEKNGVSRSLSAPTWTEEDIIATDNITGEKYTAIDLINKKLLLNYKSDGEDVFFYGQFNGKNHWDEDCVLNAYKNGNLTFIMEANYDDGQLINYKQIFSDKLNSGSEIWTYSERKHFDDMNIGDSWSYIKQNDYKQSFSISDVSPINIIYVDSIKDYLCTTPESYYHGNTSNGFYNDDTGNAYLIKYNADGTIRTLYCGNIMDGKFNDNTGNAWYITKNENTKYMYYKGIFENGSCKNDKNSERKNPLTMDMINEIVNTKNIDVELKWDMSVLDNKN